MPFVALGAAAAVFLLVQWLPGDPAVARLGESASAADLETLRRSLGLDRPLAERFARFVGGLLQGDFGRSWHSGRPTLELLGERFPATIRLGGAALLLAVGAAVPAALAATLRAGGGLDRAARAFASLATALPSYATGPVLLLLLAVQLRAFPVAGDEARGAWVLPATALAIPVSAHLFRLLRASLQEEMSRPWIAAARARGVSPLRLVARHALANAMLPFLAVLGLQLGSLLTGALVTETLFSWPGVGRLLVEAIRRRDYPLVEAGVLFLALVYLVANLLVDVAQAAADPRLRGRGEGA